MRRCFILPSFVAAAPVAAQQQSEIVVTGEALPPAPGETVYNVVTIDRARLTSSASGRLDEILKDVPGFQLFRRSDARSANPTSQGATLRALGGNASSRALLILDGVPQTDPFGGWISWPAYDPQRLGSVRVTRGGGSGVNGPGALAGTIELESAAPSELRGFSARAAYGSRDSVDLHAGVGLAVGRSFLTLSGAHAEGDGFVPVIAEQRGPADRAAPYQQSSLAARAVAPLGDAIELQASASLFSDARERGTAFSAIDTDGADASLRLVGGNWSALGYVQTRDFYNSFASVDDARAGATQVAEQYSVPSTGVGGRVELRPALGPVALRLGGDWRHVEGETRERYNFQQGVATRAREAGGASLTAGLFAEGAREIGAATLTGGVRIDHWRIAGGFLDERLLATGAPLTDIDYADRSGWEPTARAGVAVRANDALTARGAAYIGWRLPTLNELYRPFRVGFDATAANAGLSPERLSGGEIGLDYRPHPGLRANLTLFANRLSDGIANVTLGRGPGLFPGVGFVSAAGEYRQRRNIDAIVARGIEIGAGIEMNRWTLSGGYSFVDAEVDASGVAAALDGLRPAQTPRHSFAATLGWQGPRALRASLTARYVGGQYEDDLNTQLLPAALTFDAVASVPISASLSLEARAENLTDKRVAAGINSDGIIERATPRTLWIGLRFSPR